MQLRNRRSWEQLRNWWQLGGRLGWDLEDDWWHLVGEMGGGGRVGWWEKVGQEKARRAGGGVVLVVEYPDPPSGLVSWFPDILPKKRPATVVFRIGTIQPGGFQSEGFVLFLLMFS